MSGEKDLQKLLAGMSPELDPNRYVFATTTEPVSIDGSDIIMRFTETEGETLILSPSVAAAAGLTHSDAYARITLSVHSALDAVGFLAAVCSELAEHGISTNAVAAYHHDHIFVPLDRAEDAMAALKALSASI